MDILKKKKKKKKTRKKAKCIQKAFFIQITLITDPLKPEMKCVVKNV